MPVHTDYYDVYLPWCREWFQVVTLSEGMALMSLVIVQNEAPPSAFTVWATHRVNVIAHEASSDIDLRKRSTPIIDCDQQTLSLPIWMRGMPSSF